MSDLEKTTEAGFLALIAVAIQTRDGNKGQPTDNELLAAKMLFRNVYANLIE